MRMKPLLVVYLVALALASSPANETPQVSGVIDGKKVEFAPEVGTLVADKSVALLASCAFKDFHTTQGLADVVKQSHLRVTFASARKVEVPIEEITVAVKEMVITLPLSSGRILVRTDKGVFFYFAKFKNTIVEDLQKLLKEAKHSSGE